VYTDNYAFNHKVELKQVDTDDDGIKYSCQVSGDHHMTRQSFRDLQR
jgi:hypothetical protein